MCIHISISGRCFQLLSIRNRLLVFSLLSLCGQSHSFLLGADGERDCCLTESPGSLSEGSANFTLPQLLRVRPDTRDLPFWLWSLRGHVVVSTCVSLMTKDTECLLQCLSNIWLSSSEKFLFRSSLFLHIQTSR